MKFKRKGNLTKRKKTIKRIRIEIEMKKKTLRGEFENKRQFNKRQIKNNQKNEDQIKKTQIRIE